MSDTPATRPTGASVAAFLDAVEPAGRREDAQALHRLMARVTGEAGEMWGPSIVGYGRYRYRYESGREGEWMLTGFAPRKANMVVYIMPGFEGAEALLARLGRHRTGRSCLYLGRLSGVDLGVLEELVAGSVATMRERHGA